MIHYWVAVEDRVSQDRVVIGAMLTVDEVRDIVKFLQKYNATDFLIVKGVEEIVK